MSTTNAENPTINGPSKPEPGVVSSSKSNKKKKNKRNKKKHNQNKNVIDTDSNCSQDSAIGSVATTTSSVGSGDNSTIKTTNNSIENSNVDSPSEGLSNNSLENQTIKEEPEEENSSNNNSSDDDTESLDKSPSSEKLDQSLDEIEPKLEQDNNNNTDDTSGVENVSLNSSDSDSGENTEKKQQQIGIGESVETTVEISHVVENSESSEDEVSTESSDSNSDTSSDDNEDISGLNPIANRSNQNFLTNSLYTKAAIGSGNMSVPYKPRHNMDFDEMLSACSKCKYLPENDMRRLCDYVMDILLEEPNVVSLQSPVTICGDVHGQFFDLLELFRTGGEVPSTNYVFLGDFVDRGHYSLETFTYLLVLKARYPNRITLLRGNHETRQITQVYGFYEECQQKYGNANIWRSCSRVFDLLSIAALIDNSVLCVHGGLSPDVRTIDQIRTIERQQEVPHQGAFCDLVWSDPDDVDVWQQSPRGAGYLFGANQTEEFVQLNDLECIARAHQLVLEGIRHQFDDKLVTVWSAPNYCYRCGNVAAVYQVSSDGQRTAKLFQAVPDNQREVPSKVVTPYFL